MNLLKEYHFRIPLNEDDDEIDIDSPDTSQNTEAQIEQPENTEASLQKLNPENMQGINVTELVKKQDEVIAKFNDVIGKLNHITNIPDDLKDTSTKLNQLETGVIKQIDDLRTEIKQRLPSDTEKLRLRALSSYPYNTPLDDYFIKNNYNKSLKYEANDKKVEAYILKVEDIENGYNEYDVKNSF